MRQAAHYHAQALVRRLLEADLVDVPKIVGQVRPLRKLHRSPSCGKEQQAAADQSQAKLHTALALLAVDESQLTTFMNGSCRRHRGSSRSSGMRWPSIGEKLSGRLWSDAESAEKRGTALPRGRRAGHL